VYFMAFLCVGIVWIRGGCGKLVDGGVDRAGG
jgi:hypothetical protein